MMNKEIEDIFKKLEDPNFENQTSKDEREFLSLKERSNQNKMHVQPSNNSKTKVGQLLQTACSTVEQQ